VWTDGSETCRKTESNVGKLPSGQSECPIARFHGTLLNRLVSNIARSDVMSVKLYRTALNWSVRLSALLTLALIVCAVTGCRRGPTNKSQQTQVVYTAVTNPVRELCTDDSESRTESFSVPVVRFEGSRILLNSAEVSAKSLREWALQKYGNLPEKVIRVQFSDDDQHAANQALLPIVTALPDLHVRRAPFSFSCHKL
jgi:hypothetical protein